MHRRLENSVGSRDLDLSTRKWDISYKREEKHFAKFEIYVLFLYFRAWACPGFFIGGKNERPKAESGVGSWGGAITPLPTN